MALPTTPPRAIGRYLLFDAVASGGMATVHYGRMTGPAGFARTVAIKRLHPQFAKEPEFIAMLIDEARLAARIRHPNVVSILDVVNTGDETLLVMEYVQGLTLAHLVRHARATHIPLEIASAVLSGALEGLHAAHEACSEDGAPLGIVHRDVSPQNILIGSDGVARVTDFGIAKAAGRLQTTRDGQIKGKTAYMAPEQIRGRDIDRRTDVYAASVVLWETLTGRRLFTGDTAAGILNAVLEAEVAAVSQVRSDEVPAALDSVVSKGLSRDPGARFATAREMAIELERALRPASARDVGEWIAQTASELLQQRARQVAHMEASSSEGGRIVGGVAADVPEPDLHTTSSSVVSDPIAPRRRKTLLALVTIAAAAVLGATATFVGLRTPGSSPRPSVDIPASAPTLAPATASATVSPEASGSVEAGLATPAVDAPSAAVPVPIPRARTRPAPVSPQPRLDCSPPYEIDANGTRHWKNGC